MNLAEYVGDERGLNRYMQPKYYGKEWAPRIDPSGRGNDEIEDRIHEERQKRREIGVDPSVPHRNENGEGKPKTLKEWKGPHVLRLRRNSPKEKNLGYFPTEARKTACRWVLDAATDTHSPRADGVIAWNKNNTVSFPKKLCLVMSPPLALKRRYCKPRA